MAKKKEFNVKEWLDENLKGSDVSDDDRKVLDRVLANEKVLPKVSASFMRQTDYSAAHDSLREEREKFDQETKKAKDDYAAKLQQLSEWEGTAKQTLEAEQKAKAELEKKLAATERRYRKAAKEAGLDDDDLDDDDTPPVRTSGMSKEDLDKYLADREKKLRADLDKEFKSSATELVNVLGRFPIEVGNLNNKHQKLFGEPLDWEKLHAKHQETGEPYDKLWAKEYNVAERQAELAEEAQRKHDEEVRAEERRKVLEEVSRPAMVEPESFGSPAMKKFAAKPDGDSARTDGLSPVDRAVLAAREHKHAPPTSPHWKGNQGAGAA